MKVWLLLLIPFVLFSCSPKKDSATKTETSSEAKQDWKDEYFFSKLQIVTETQAGENCEERQKLTERDEKQFRFKLGQDGRIQVIRDDWAPIFYILNIRIKAIGFDNTSYTFSSIDGFVPRFIPYELSIRRVPGGGGDIQVQFFDQSVQVDLEETPVASFSATENRDGCEITHNINLFAEDAGEFEVAKSN